MSGHQDIGQLSERVVYVTGAVFRSPVLLHLLPLQVVEGGQRMPVLVGSLLAGQQAIGIGGVVGRRVGDVGNRLLLASCMPCHPWHGGFRLPSKTIIGEAAVAVAVAILRR